MKDFRLVILGTSGFITLTTSLLLYFSGTDEISTLSVAIIFFVSLGSIWVVFKYFVANDMDNIRYTVKQMSRKSLFNLSKTRKYYFKGNKQLDRTIQDISGSMNEKIQEYKRMADFRKDFIANVSHELKTPIFSAQGFVHTLLDGAVKDKQVRTRFLKKAAKSLDGLDMLVQDLLTLSQIEIGEIRMHFEYFDIHRMCLDVFDQLESNAEKKNVKLELISPKRQLIVYADFKRIHQVISNLIQNAIKYNNDDGWVQVRLEEESSNVLIRIVDSGEGIGEDHLSRIFERFYRIEKSRNRAKGGTGLGLSIVKHVLEGHNSNVLVESILNEGTSFSFRLPKVKDLKSKG